jgi:hypothetical protein
MTNILSSLLVSEEDVACEALGEALQRLIQIGQSSGNPIPTAEFEKADRTTKLLAYLLALRAAAILGVGKKIGATAEELAPIVGSDVKSVRECASRLTRRFLSRGPSGYEVPTEKIRATCAAITSRL